MITLYPNIINDNKVWMFWLNHAKTAKRFCMEFGVKLARLT